MKKLILFSFFLFSFPSSVLADIYYFEIKVMDEGIETLDYEIYFEGKYREIIPYWSNQNKFDFDTDYRHLDSNVIITLKYKGENYKIKNLPTSIIQSAKVEINFSKDNLERNKIERTDNQILIIERDFSFKMEGLGNVLYGSFCWRRYGKYSNAPFVPGVKVYLERKLSGTPASTQHK
ncbi:MAG: hypothetical protein AB8F94_14740 [Saprospiraceae bacterium]